MHDLSGLGIRLFYRRILFLVYRVKPVCRRLESEYAGVREYAFLFCIPLTHIGNLKQANVKCIK